eukprot:3218459-Pyramimonas_sp.AAC.1
MAPKTPGVQVHGPHCEDSPWATEASYAEHAVDLAKHQRADGAWGFLSTAWAKFVVRAAQRLSHVTATEIKDFNSFARCPTPRWVE